MSSKPSTDTEKLSGVVFALGEQPIFRPADIVSSRQPCDPKTRSAIPEDPGADRD